MPDFTTQMKLEALEHKYYLAAPEGKPWEPKEFDHYTLTRTDLELFLVVEVTDEKIGVKMVKGSDGKDTLQMVSYWPKRQFLSMTEFMPNRVFVPNWIYPGRT